MVLRVACTFMREMDHACGKRPVVVEYVVIDVLLGERWVVSLCADHDTDDARQIAKKLGYERRPPE